MMKGVFKTLLQLITLGVWVASSFTFSAFGQNQKVRVGFLIHDLISERWKKDMDNFSIKIEELGGETIVKNAYGDANVQVTQGKMLIDEGVKVLAVVAQDGKILAELVDYANKAGATIIAYDHIILNCDLPFYISFNSVRVGELMAEYVLKLKPQGNYIILEGPSYDNNALLVKEGIMNKLRSSIDNGNVKILLEKELDSWYALSSLMAINDFIAKNKKPIDVVVASSDDLALGALDAFMATKLPIPLITGQDATVDACKNIVLGYLAMTVYKSIKKLSSEAAVLAMKIAKGEKIVTTTTVNNGKSNVPSILFDPIAVDKNNLRKTVIAEGQVKESDLK